MVAALRQQLRQLEAHGVVTRSVEQRATLRVRYRLTPHGRTLLARARGLLKDLDATGDTARTDRAFHDFLATINSA